MKVVPTGLAGVFMFVPTPFHDDRGFFSRTFDVAVAEEAGVDGSTFLQESQSRTRRHVLRGIHGRAGAGEGKIIRCARGGIHLVVVDGRIASSTFGSHIAHRLDDEGMASVYVPPGMLVGFQALSEYADVCYKIDRVHVEAEGIAVRYDDPELGIVWPHPVAGLSRRDQAAPRWADVHSAV
jgi:dTDP-4-dehydrorhamnose 3,5-epimerase